MKLISSTFKRLKDFFNKPNILGIFFFSIGLFFSIQALKKTRIIWMQNFDQYLWIGFSLTSLLIANVLFIYGKNKKLFMKRYSLCISYSKSFKGEKAQTGLFRETFKFILMFLVIILFSIGIIWLIYLMGDWLVWPFCLLVILYSIRSLYGQKGAIIFHILYIPLMSFYLIFGIKIFAAILGIVVILALFWAKRSKQIKKDRLPKVRLTNELIEIYRLVKYLNFKIHKKIYGRGTVQSFQSICISFVVLFFVIGPFLANFLPDPYDTLITKYDLVVKESWDYIPYLAFIFFMGLSTVPLLEFFIRPVSFVKDEDSALKRGGNFIIIILIAFMVLPIFIVFSFTIAAIIVAIGNSVIGIKFAVIIGFFVFPNWATKVFAVVPTLALFIYPKGMLLKWLH